MDKPMDKKKPMFYPIDIPLGKTPLKFYPLTYPLGEMTISIQKGTGTT